MLVIATGNNLVLAGDVSRRAVICRLDAKVERPDMVPHSFDPRQEARAKRPELVAAGLTVLLGYIAAGKPNPPAEWGGFETWNLVRGALVWLGYPDPATTRDRLFADDPKKGALVDLLRLWREAHGGDEKRLNEIRIEGEADDVAGPAAALVAELIAMTRHRDFNSRSVGRHLQQHVDRIAGGLVLLSRTDSSGTRLYWVKDSAAGTDNNAASPADDTDDLF